jgi:glycerophosphoryl diester phosphodiesterase
LTKSPKEKQNVKESFGLSRCGPDTFAAIRQCGLRIFLWHEERPAELRELVKLDVDGVCTDTPDVLTSILREKQEKS